MSKTEIILRDELTQIGEELLSTRKGVGARLDGVEISTAEMRATLGEVQLAMAKQNQSIH